MVIVIASHAESEDNDWSPVPPSGMDGTWVTELQVGQVPPSMPGVHVFYELCDGGESGTRTMTADFAGGYDGLCFVIRGVDTTTPLDVAVQTVQSSTAGDPDSPTITPTNDDTLILAIGLQDATGAVTLSSYPTSYTGIGFINNNQFTGESLMAAYRILVGGGSSSENPSVFDTSIAEEWAAISIALRPAAGDIDFQMDLEVQFTDVMDFMAVEKICIETGTFVGSENINVTYWGGSSWSSITSDLTASTWNNYSVSLTSSTFTIKFGGSTTSSDTVMDGWEIDSVLLQYSGAGLVEDYVDTQSDIDSTADRGTHSSFNNQKASDNNMDLLTETSYGAAGGTYGHGIGAGTESTTSGYMYFCSEGSGVWSTFSDGGLVESISLDSDSDSSADFNFYRGTISGNTFSFTYGYDPVASVNPSGDGWQTFTSPSDFTAFTVLSGDVLAAFSDAASSLIGRSDTGSYLEYGYSAGTEPFSGDLTISTGGTAKRMEISVTASPVPNDYVLELEGQFSGLPDEADSMPVQELCIETGTFSSSEDILVQWWDGDSWEQLWSDLTASSWNNKTIEGNLTGSTFTIRFRDGTQTSDASTQDTWNIDAVLIHLENTGGGSDVYELDLEIGWTSADFDETQEQLCILPVTGGGWPSEDIKVDVWSGSWTNVFSDLTPDQWNNVSISSYLTGAAFEIRFLGGTETGDTIQDTWEIDAVLIHTWTPSYIPANDQTPTLDNPSDTDNMYAQYLEYQVTVYVSDQNGYADIDYLEIGLWDNTQTTEYCRFRYDEDTNAFTEEYDIGTAVSLNTGSSTATEAGNDIDATFYFTVDWDFPDSTDLDARCYVIDTQTESATTWYEVNWDVETRLEYSVTPSIDDASGTVDRGNLDGSFSLTGTVIYYTSADDFPASTAVDVWVSASEYGTTVGPWSDLTLTSGAFDVTCYADDIVGQDTYTIKVVEESTGAGGTDLYYTTSVTDTYIADRVQVQSYSVTDARVNVNDNVDIDVTLYYDYDNSAVIDGTVTVNGASATHQGTGVWRITDSEATVMANTYNAVTYSVGTHGITTVDQNAQSQQIIWDQVIVVSYNVVDNRVDINTAVNVDVTLQYDYDNAAVTDGTVTINVIPATHQGAGVWRISPSQASVTVVTYNLVAASGNAHGISSINQNGQSQQVIWDQITVTGYTVSDGRVNINDNVNIDVTIEYAYDNAAVIDGTITINGNSATHQGAGVWRYVASQSTVQQVTYNTVACSGNTEGISSVNQNGQSISAIWDRISVQTTVVDDGRVGISTGAEIRVTLWLEYDSTFLGSGDAVTLDGVAMTWDVGNSWFDLSRTQASVGLWVYFVNSSSEATFGITELNLNSQSVSVIWDRVQVQSYSVTDDRVNINDNVDIDVTLYYDYDNSVVIDGTVTINGASATHQGAGIWRATDSKATIQLFTYDTVVASGNTHGISAVDQNSQTQDVIWDRVQVQSYSVIDARVNVNDNVDVDATLYYDYDDSAVTDGTVTINGAPATYQGLGVWRITASEAVVMSNTYNTIASSGNSHGISTVDQNGQSQLIIWDQITVRSYSVSDLRANVGDTVNIDVTVEYEFDDTDVTDGIVTINGVSATHQGLGVWRITDSEITVVLNTYDTVACSANTEGITSVNQNTQSVDVIWDRVQVQSYSVSDGRVGLNDNINIDVTIVYDYDNAAVTDGTVTINGLSAAHQGTGVWRVTDSEASVMANTYNTIACSGNTFGISDVDQNGQSAMAIWDQIVVTIGVDDSTPLNGIQTNFTLGVIFDYDDVACTTYQIVIQRNGTWWRSFTDTNKSQFVDTNSDTSYTYIVLVVTSESTYSVLAFSTNSQQVVWSAAPNSAPVNDVAPVLTNPDDTDNIYARYNYYIITSNVSDVDGYSDIDYVELTLYDDSRATPVWTVRYTVSGGTFSIELGSEYIVLSVSSSAFGSGNDLDITWFIKIDWDHSDLTDVDTRQYVHDGVIGVEDFNESNWDVETRLEVTGLSVDDGSGTATRGPLDGAITVSGTVIYLGSVDNNPLSNETDIWVSSSEYGTTVGPWSDLTLSSGQFSLTAYTDDQVGQDTLTVKGVNEAAGFGGTDLLGSTTQSTFIADRVQVQSYSVSDTRDNIGDTVTIDVTLYYEYDSAQVLDGSVTVNGIVATHQGSGVWRISDSQITVQMVTFNTVAFSGGTHGLNAVNQNSQSQDVIWDALIITMSDPADQRIDIGTNATGILVSAVYAFDGAAFDGSFTLNNTNFQYALPQMQAYTILSSLGDTHGITAIQTNDVTFCVWDRVLVVSIDADEIYHDPNDDVMISVELQYEYDGSPILTGTFSIVSYPLTHVGSGVWEAQVTIGTYQTIDFDDLTTSSADLHGISEYNMNSQTTTVYWDRLEFYAATVLDNRISIGDSAEIQWSVRLEDAGIPLTTGVIAQMTGSVSLSPSGGFLTGTTSQSTVGSMTYAIITASIGEINEFSQSATDVTVIWDRIKVVSVTASLFSLDVGQSVEIRVTLVYEFDNSPVEDGTVYLDNNGVSAQMVYNFAEGYWTATITQSSADDYSFTVQSIEGNTAGITALNLDGKSVLVEWVSVAGPAFDTMTLVLAGGGVGIAVIGAVIVASRRRKSHEPEGLGEIDPTGFGVEDVAAPEAIDEVDIVSETADVVIEEPEIAEPEVEEVAELETESMVPEELVEEPETEAVEEPEIVEPEVEAEEIDFEEELRLLDLDEKVEVEPFVAPEESDKSAPAIKEVDEIEPEVEVIEDSVEEPEVEVRRERDEVWSETAPKEDLVFSFHPGHLTEEIRSKPPLVTKERKFSWDDSVALGNLLALTKSELVALIPDDYKTRTDEKKLMRMTKKELISLIELLRFRDTL